MEGKEALWNKRPLTAIQKDEELLTFRPDDPEILFDLGRLYYAIGDNRTARNYYERTLSFSPGHIYAAAALEDATLDAGHNTGLRFDYADKNGFNDEFRITETDVTAWYLTPIVGDDWRVEAEADEAFFSFPQTDNIYATRMGLGIRKSFPPYGPLLRFFMRESVYSGVGNTYTNNWLASINYRATDMLEMGGGVVREDVLENYNTVKEHTNRDKVFGTIGSDLSRRLRLDLRGDFMRYKDTNTAIDLSGTAGYELMQFPRLLQLSWQSEYWAYQHSGKIYFSPSSYSQHGPTLHWRHYLGDEKFLPGQQFYYGLKASTKLDSDAVFFWGGGGELLWDITKQWQVSADFSFQDSDVYREFLTTMGVRYRF
jgi:hypothetical protein